MTEAACAGWHCNSAVPTGVLLFLLLALIPVSSERSRSYPLSTSPAFVAPVAGTELPAGCRGGFLKSNVQLKRAHTTTAAGHRKLLPSHLGPNHGRDSLGRPPPYLPAERSCSGGSLRSPAVAPGLPPPGAARTSKRTSFVVASAAGRRGTGGGGEEGRRDGGDEGKRKRRRRFGGSAETPRQGERRSIRRRAGWRRLAAAGTEKDGRDGEGDGVRQGGGGLGFESGDVVSSVRAGTAGAGALDRGGDAKGPKEKGDSWVRRRWRHALAKIKKEPLQILTIPVSAACVGWITNKLAVEMIFHPLVWRGIPLRVIEGQPLGLFGWQGIVPAKAGVMAERMVDMVTTQLVDVEEVFGRLSPGKIARLLGPEIDTIVQDVYGELAPKPLAWLPGSFGAGLVPQAVDELKGLRRGMLVGITKDMQKQVTQVLDLKEMVVAEMLRDRSLMVSLFQRCGKAEFKFLVNSGFGFGFLLGVVQMFVWLLYDKPWTLPAGGAVVGYITNWLAIKLIFEPVNPVKMGPFVLQGLFLKRQDEVAADFAEFFSSNVLTSNKLWKAMIEGSRAEAFQELVAARVVPFVSRASAVAGANLDALVVKGLALRAASKLGDHVHVLHDYTDKTLALRETMTVQMQKMSTRTFEGVLHPVFQEEEATLIVAGAILGAVAGFLQMLLSTKGVRDAAKKAAKKAAETAAAAADGVVGAGGGLVEGVGAPVVQAGAQAGAQAAQAGAQVVQAGAQVAQAGAQRAQKKAVGWGQRAVSAARRYTTPALNLAVNKCRRLSEAGRAAAAAVADRYHRRRRRGNGGGGGDDGSGDDRVDEVADQRSSSSSSFSSSSSSSSDMTSSPGVSCDDRHSEASGSGTDLSDTPRPPTD